jgi:hypothetical protein
MIDARGLEKLDFRFRHVPLRLGVEPHLNPGGA